MVKRCRNVLCDGDRVVSAARKLTRARKVQLLLRAVALLQLQQLCKTWEDAEHVNHSVYDIRRLSSLQHEDMTQAFAPLHSGLCATCGRLLGRSIGSDEYVLEPQRGKNIPCSQYAQPPCLLLWSKRRLCEFCPEVFEIGENSKLCLRQRWRHMPP